MDINVIVVVYLAKLMSRAISTCGGTSVYDDLTMV